MTPHHSVHVSCLDPVSDHGHGSLDVEQFHPGLLPLTGVPGVTMDGPF